MQPGTDGLKLAVDTLLRGVTLQAAIDFQGSTGCFARPAQQRKPPALTLQDLWLANLPPNPTATARGGARAPLGQATSLAWLVANSDAPLSGGQGTPSRRIKRCTAIVSCEEVQFMQALAARLRRSRNGLTAKQRVRRYAVRLATPPNRCTAVHVSYRHAASQNRQAFDLHAYHALLVEQTFYDNIS